MATGAITGYVDVAQIVLYVFWAFFAGLIYYLLRENKREGYPLVSDRSKHVTVQGWPPIPAPKTFLLPHGGTVQVPRTGEEPPIAARPYAGFPGAPLQPLGDPMRDGVGPASYALREDKPEMTINHEPLIVPLRIVPEALVAPEDPDPRGMAAVGCDGKTAGTVQDLWIDRAEPQIRYLEVALASGGTRLLPMTLAKVHGDKRRVTVASVTAAQFAGAPETRSNEQVTKLEEDKITAYFASGLLYATPDRLGPLL
jgi:photosynthetic reaction center H subunit